MNHQQNELQPPLQQSNITKFNIANNGDISFTGEMTPENKQLLEQALQQAEYYKSKASSLEQQKLKRSTDNDAVLIAFGAFVLMLMMFFSFVTVSCISSMIKSQPHSQTISNNVRT